MAFDKWVKRWKKKCGIAAIKSIKISGKVWSSDVLSNYKSQGHKHPTIPQGHFQLCSSALGSAAVGVPINCFATRAGCASDWRGWTSMAFKIVLPSAYLVMSWDSTKLSVSTKAGGPNMLPVWFWLSVYLPVSCLRFIVLFHLQPKLPREKKPGTMTSHTRNTSSISIRSRGKQWTNLETNLRQTSIPTLQYRKTNSLAVFHLQIGCISNLKNLGSIGVSCVFAHHFLGKFWKVSWYLILRCTVDGQNRVNQLIW